MGEVVYLSPMRREELMCRQPLLCIVHRFSLETYICTEISTANRDRTQKHVAHVTVTVGQLKLKVSCRALSEAI